MPKNRANVVPMSVTLHRASHAYLKATRREIEKKIGLKIPMCRLVDQVLIMGMNGVRQFYTLELRSDEQVAKMLEEVRS